MKQRVHADQCGFFCRRQHCSFEGMDLHCGVVAKHVVHVSHILAWKDTGYNQHLLQVASPVLSLMGNSQVTAVRDGQHAIDEVHLQGGADAFAIILTDLQMPHKVPPAVALFSLLIKHLRVAACPLHVCAVHVTT